ncbi:MAG: type II toxin-antitoxin system Phd/YefM family antitoxin [Actinomycetia bacterium]|nr:type II toxin-antitoxin system Phd/YefM family antitoxin [Actinomycetes bacterium]
MAFITANELKKKGVSLLEDKVGKDEETIITVRGKSKYVIIGMEKYNQYREYELNAAIIEARKDIEKGNFIIERVGDHIKRLKKNL